MTFSVGDFSLGLQNFLLDDLLFSTSAGTVSLPTN